MDNSQTLELQIKSVSSNACKDVDKLIRSLTGIENKVDSISNKLGQTNQISNFINEMNKATLSAKRLSKIDMNQFKSQLNSLYDTITKFSSSLTGVNTNSLENLNKTFRGIPNSINKINELDMRKTYNSFNSLTRILDPFLKKLQQSEVSLSNFVQISKSIDNVKQKTDKATNSADKLSNAFKKAFTFAGVKRLTLNALEWMNEAIDYTEQLNLFNVVFDNTEKNGKQMFSELGKEALQFQYKLNEAFGTNKTQSLYTQAIFQSMGENQGISDYYANIMSETMTKFTYDLASLYNKTEKATAEALRASVYSGQTKPARNYGLDVTQQTMQPILNELGIDKQVKELSQAEKMILRYISVLKQGQVAMGDFANTCESPSNQLKILRQQLIETKVAFSSLFIGALSNALPYANAFLMIIKETSKAIATMFGIELKDYNSGIASQEGIYDGIEESADNASKAVKELKRQTLGFDEIHNISENDNSDSGTSVSGGIDQRLLDAITGYDNGMDKVRMKAAEIRDKWMEILGFHKEVDPLTGEISFKYGGIGKTLSNIWKSFKGLSTEGKVLVGLGLGVGATKLWNTGKKLVTVFGNSGLGKALKTSLIPFKTLGTNMLNLIQYTRVYISLTGSLKNGIIGGIEAWRKQNVIVKDSCGSVDKFKTSMNGAKIAVQGLITGAVGLYTVNKSMKSLSTDGANLANVLGLVTGSLTTIASGVQIGAIFGPWGAIIGGATGAVFGLISAIGGYETASEKMIKSSEKDLETAQQNLQNYYDTKKAIEDSMNNELAFQDYNKTLLDELEQLVEANGKVKTGYEDRVNFILNELNSAYGTEYSIIDGTISGYEDLKKSIEDVIQTKKANIMLDAEEKNYKNAIQNQKQAWKDYNDALKKYNENNNKANEILNKKYELEKLVGTQAYKNYIYYSELTKEEYKGPYAYNAIVRDLETYNKTLKTNQQTLNDNRTTFENYTNDIVFYEDLQTAVLSNNVKKQNQLIEERLNTITTANGEEKLSLSEQLEYYDDVANKKMKILKSNGVEITDEMKTQAYAQKQILMDNLIEQSKTIGLNDDVIESWRDLANNSTEEFSKVFNKLPIELQNELLPKLKLSASTLSKAINSGIKLDGTELFKSWNNIFQTIIEKINKLTHFNIKLPDLSSLLIKTPNLTKTLSSLGFKANGGIYSNGSWKDIQQYANGGAPSQGTLFWAGEAGAEVVAHANGKTEVLNQSQIASAIYSATLSAMSQAMSQYGGQSSEIDVHVHTDEGTVIDRINQKTRQTGVCPINIPIY